MAARPPLAQAFFAISGVSLGAAGGAVVLGAYGEDDEPSAGSSSGGDPARAPKSTS